MTDREYEVHRTLKGTQITRVTARSKADAVRQVLDGHGEPITFEITEAARTAIAMEVDW